MNAKEELLEFLNDNCLQLIAASITYEPLYYDKFLEFTLFNNFTFNEYEKFINGLNFEYDCGYGSQELYGTLWFSDASWAERYEYDGSERWVLRKLPKVPIKQRMASVHQSINITSL